MKKRILMVAMVVLALMVSLSVALADESRPPEDQISLDPNFASYEWHRMVRSENFGLAMTKASITKLSSTSVSVYGYTEGNEKCAVVGGTIYLQQWNDNKWNNYHSITFTGREVYMFSATRTVTVESGKYYRVFVSHYGVAYDGNQMGMSSTTKSIYVN
ncbi:MAG: hypothetical protein J1E43_11860 [Christensenellaceae bacterium]|nr:hypothetical protein [Christensenellaceae bacterium]